MTYIDHPLLAEPPIPPPCCDHPACWNAYAGPTPPSNGELAAMARRDVIEQMRKDAHEYIDAALRDPEGADQYVEWSRLSWQIADMLEEGDDAADDD